MVEATDGSTATFRQFISVEVGNVNEAPTAIGLDKGDYAEVLENQPKDTFVSLISTVDPESEDTHTYRITGGADKSLFAISGIELYTKAPLDYETKPVLDIIIEAKDPGGLTYEQQLEVRVLNANDPPTDISVNQTSFPENLEIGSFIAELSATDSGINRGFEVISGRFNWDQANEDAQSRVVTLRHSPVRKSGMKHLRLSQAQKTVSISGLAPATRRRRLEMGYWQPWCGQIGVKLAIQNLMAVHVRTGVSLNSVTPIPGTI